MTGKFGQAWLWHLWGNSAFKLSGWQGQAQAGHVCLWEWGFVARWDVVLRGHVVRGAQTASQSHFDACAATKVLPMTARTCMSALQSHTAAQCGYASAAAHSSTVLHCSHLEHPHHMRKHTCVVVQSPEFLTLHCRGGEVVVRVSRTSGCVVGLSSNGMQLLQGEFQPCLFR